MQEDHGYALCPKCLDNDRARAESKESDLRIKYGRVSLDNWLDLQASLNKAQEDMRDPDASALREVFHAGFSDGEPVLEISYKCVCDTCDFEFSFTHKETIRVSDGI